MRTILLLIIGGAFFISCEKTKGGESPILPEEPTLFGDWQTTHQYLSVTMSEATPSSYTEMLKEEIEQEVSEDVSEADSYRLSFNDDGTGTGSRVLHYGGGRGDFKFKWELSETGPWWYPEQSFDDSWISMEEPFDGYYGVFSTWDGLALESVDWKIEELTVDKLILSHLEIREVNDSNIGAIWNETHTYRYTFEKVK